MLLPKYDIKRTYDRLLIKAITQDEYEHMSGDDSIPFEEWEPYLDPKKYFWWVLLRTINNVPTVIGIMLFDKINSDTYNTHIVVHKNFRGRTEPLAKLALHKMKTVYNAKAFLALTHNKKARDLAIKCGYKLASTLKQSFKFKGKYMDQYLLEYSE